MNGIISEKKKTGFNNVEKRATTHTDPWCDSYRLHNYQPQYLQPKSQGLIIERKNVKN